MLLTYPQVVETFQDTNSALKALSAASESGSTDPRREERWERAKEVFEKQAGRMSATGTSVAQSLCSDPKAAWEIKRSADKLGKLTQQTVFAAKVVLMNPDKKVVLFLDACSIYSTRAVASQGAPQRVEG